MKKLGFEFTEVMSGTYTRTGQPEQTGAIRFQGRARARDTLRHLRDGLVDLEGTVDIEGFADDVPLSGTIEIRPVLGKVIRYDFTFTGNDGHPYRFSGQKDVRFAELVRTMTTLTGAITTAAGDEVARATLHFDVKADLLPFLVSWKTALA